MSLCLATQASAVASGWSQQAQITSGVTAGDDGFGTAVALSGNTLIVSSPDGTSSAYVYTLTGSTWTLQADLTDGTHEFGSCVSVAGNVAVISHLNGAEGWSYVFDRSGSTWTEQAAIHSACGQISPSGNEFLATNYAKTGQSTGPAVYSKNAKGEWVVQLLPVPEGSKVLGDLAKAISGNTAIVEGLNSSGAQTVYVFQHTSKTWTEQAALEPKVAAAGDDFGASVALSSDGETAVVGAPLAAGGGSAYIFTRSASTWTQQAVLTQSSALPVRANFGDSVAILGNDVVVGARNGSKGGPVDFYPHTASGWGAAVEMPRSATTATGFYGFSVAIGTTSSGPTVAVGAPGNVGPGAAYVFTS
jgi:hypothetical protein